MACVMEKIRKGACHCAAPQCSLKKTSMNPGISMRKNNEDQKWVEKEVTY